MDRSRAAHSEFGVSGEGFRSAWRPRHSDTSTGTGNLGKNGAKAKAKAMKRHIGIVGKAALASAALAAPTTPAIAAKPESPIAPANCELP